MHVYAWILIIGLPFVLINEAARPAGKAAGKQKRITRSHTTEEPKNKSGIHESVKNNGSRKWPRKWDNRTQPPFRLYQISGKTAFTVKPWDEENLGKLENGTMTFYNRLGGAVLIHEFKHFIYKNGENIYSEKFKNIVIQRARLTGDITFHYHPSDSEYTDYWTIWCIYDGHNRTTSLEMCQYNIGPKPGAILFISFHKHQPTGLSFRRVGANEATFAMRARLR